jgi:hypothetical protein
MNMQETPQAEKRLGGRRMRTLKGGRIVFNAGFGVFDCVVRNISQGGAMLQLSGPLGIPSRFELVMDPGTPRRKCTVRWRTDNAIGVSFDPPDDAAPGAASGTP